MEIIRGKHASSIDTSALIKRLVGYSSIHIDIGTGDGRFVRHIAQSDPDRFAIGIDACRENLHEASRSGGMNTLFVIANAQTLPPELYGLASQITINFPGGSLLEGLLTDDSGLMAGLAAITRPDARIEVRMNGGALAEIGWSLEEGAYQVRRVLAVNGFKMRSAIPLTAHDLRVYPTTWAKRLAFGRDPHGICLCGTRKIVDMIYPTRTLHTA